MSWTMDKLFSSLKSVQIPQLPPLPELSWSVSSAAMERIAWAVGGAAIAMAALEYSSRKKGPSKKQHMMFRTKIKKSKVNDYIRYHQGVWPEVEKGLRESGVNLLSIHQPLDGSNEFAMLIEIEGHTDLSKDLGPGSKYREVARVKQWEELQSSMFETGAWEMLQEVYTLTPYSTTNTLDPEYPRA